MAAPRRRAKPRRRLPAALGLMVVLIVAVLVIVTRFDAAPQADRPSDPTGSPGATASPTTPVIPPPPRPRRAQCRDLSYQAALATSDDTAPIPCSLPHTAMTIAVEPLPGDPAVGGAEPLPTTTVRSRTRVAATCRREAATFLGGTAEQRELTMLQVVWFVPTPEQIEAGADWFRCDLIALRADAELLPLTGRLRGVVTGDGAERYAICGTAAPGAPGFGRVVCSAPHRWRAISIVPLADAAGPRGRYPGEAAVRERGQEPCQNAGQDAADDPLDFQWGYEWPTAEQWSAGQTYGICWIPA